MHVKRWITGIVAVPIVIAWIGLLPARALGWLVAAVACLALWEFYAIAMAGIARATARPLAAVGMLAAAAMVLVAGGAAGRLLPAILAADLLVVGLWTVLRFGADRTVAHAACVQLAGLVYVPLAASALVVLRHQPQGVAWLFFLLAAVAAGDTGAYYTGRWIGRTPLCPAVSPKKTVEGAAGGLAANALVAAVFKLWVPEAAGWAAAVGFALACGAAGQVGDLFESAFKRAADIKDSGRLLPGHGGFLDRIDALLFAAPLALALRAWIG